MKLENVFELHDDDGAVSPVIGVILMVAITVILAAVIGTFVLGLGQEMNKNAPTAQLSFSQSAGNVQITHDGGDKLKEGSISLTLDGSGSEEITSTDSDSLVASWSGGNSDITAGESIEVADSHVTGGTLDPDDTVKVVWTSEDGGTSQVIAEYTIN